MKKIFFLFLIITSLSFSTDLSGVHTIKVLELNSNKVLSDAKVIVGQRSKYSNNNGTLIIQLTDDEIFNGGEISIKVEKKGYKIYSGTIAIDNKNSTIHLEKINIKQISNNKGNRKVRVMVTSKNSGALYVNSKKISNIKGGFDSSFYLTSERTEFTLDTDKAIYKKHSNLEERINHIEFTEGDLYKLKELKPKEKIVVKKIVEAKSKPKEKIVKKIKIVKEKKDVTNQDLITAIINPLKNNSAFNISGKVQNFNLEESDDGTKVFILNNGNKSELSRNIIREAKRKINSDQLLDDYTLEKIDLDITLKSSYLKNVNELISKISNNKINEKTDSLWFNDKKAMYFNMTTANNYRNSILDKSYKISYKTSKKYYEFFTKFKKNFYNEKQIKIEAISDNEVIDVLNPIFSYYGINKNTKKNILEKDENQLKPSLLTILNNIYYLDDNKFLFAKEKNNIVTIILLKNKADKKANIIKVSFIKQ